MWSIAQDSVPRSSSKILVQVSGHAVKQGHRVKYSMHVTNHEKQEMLLALLICCEFFSFHE